MILDASNKLKQVWEHLRHF